ncbi:hypothetical protein [Streptomyces sp. 3214.6]|uniref:hypothetical protein n=1 Tax=Streptomyces sp. 3214.6 TaxID=1882757 RepID=UPI001E4B6B68|nr:hypothetical protein [Streptomyces sp. 3214.6]
MPLTEWTDCREIDPHARGAVVAQRQIVDGRHALNRRAGRDHRPSLIAGPRTTLGARTQAKIRSTPVAGQVSSVDRSFVMLRRIRRRP